MKKKHFTTKRFGAGTPGWGVHSAIAQEKFRAQAEEIMHDFLVDELSEEYYEQLRYEAACTSLKELYQWMQTIDTPSKKRRQAEAFYEQKLQHLKELAKKYDQSPYCL